MAEVYVQYGVEELKPLAQQYFQKILQVHLNDKRTMKEAMSVLQQLQSSVQIRALIRHIDDYAFSQDKGILDGIQFLCKAFSQLSAKKIAGAYVYALTAGDIESLGYSVLEQLYADAWGTALIDAGRDALKKTILCDFQNNGNNQSPVYISESFGPGYYGMPLEETEKIFQLLTPSKISVQLNASAVMVPEKSVTGIYLLGLTPDVFPDAACVNCLGNTVGCRYCSLQGGNS